MGEESGARGKSPSCFVSVGFGQCDCFTNRREEEEGKEVLALFPIRFSNVESLLSARRSWLGIVRGC